MIPDEFTTAEWQAVLLVLAAQEQGRGIDRAEAALDRACGSPERALRLLSSVRGQARRTGVPAALIAHAGATPPPAADADPPGRLRPVVTISSRPTLPATTQRRPAATADRRCTLAAPVSSPERSSCTQRPTDSRPVGRCELVAGWVVAAGACLMPVLLAWSMWKGTR